MSEFKVEVRAIEEVRAHPQADRLDLCQVEGLDFQFVYAKDKLRAGDAVVYFPVDSLLPPALIQRMGLEGKLSGKEKNRVKTIRLRGEISQGVVMPLGDLGDFLTGQEEPGADVTERLGVGKYERPEPHSQEGILSRLPDFMGVYDLEGSERNREVVQILLERPVCITEKIEGTNYSISLDIGKDAILVNQHHHTIVEVEGKRENSFWQATREYDIPRAIREMARLLAAQRNITAYGELIGPGIQGNIYGLPKKRVLFYDIFADGQWIPVERKVQAIAGSTAHVGYGALVPVLAQDVTLAAWLDGRTLKAASDGQSALRNVAREGIVITPMVEGRHERIGRLILKQRSPDYLAKSDA